jgi:hypothetical protein
VAAFVAKSGSKLRLSYSWLIVLAGVAAFGLATWIRFELAPRPSPLERLIERGAPAESVTTITTLRDGANIIGTTTGAILRSDTTLKHLDGLAGDVRSVAEDSGGRLLLAGRGTGVRWYLGGETGTLLTGDANAVVNTGGLRLLALLNNRTLMESKDQGETWAKLADFTGEAITTIAALTPEQVVAGGIQGGMYISYDGGRIWEAVTAPGGTVTALLFDTSTKPARLWACAGGSVLYSDDGAATWRHPARKPADRPLVGLAATKDGGILGVSADGLLVRIGD